MPRNKNAVIRYMFLDQLLSDQKHQYTCLDLVIKVNQMLVQAGYPGICDGKARSREDVTAENAEDYKSGKRLIQMDIQDLQDGPFYMEIDSSEKAYGAPIYRYKDPTRTLFSKQLSDDEKRLLREVMDTLGQFSGIESFEWLHNLRERLNDKRSFGDSRFNIGEDDTDDKRAIISFESNPYLKNKEYLPKLFSFISAKQTIIVNYQRFNESLIRELVVYPYLLKEYNNRWYLISTPMVDENGKYNPEMIYNLPLDRMIGEIIPDTKHRFKECAVNLDERFEETIGLSYYPEYPMEEVVFAIKENKAPYIETKPLHESQRSCMDERYHIDGYKTFCLDCRYNYELMAKLYSYGDEIIVLSPAHLREKIIMRLQEQMKGYRLTENTESQDAVSDITGIE